MWERKRIIFTCSSMCRCTYSATPVKVQVQSIICRGWCKSGQGETCWFELYPCRSSEGARDLFYTGQNRGTSVEV